MTRHHVRLGARVLFHERAKRNEAAQQALLRVEGVLDARLSGLESRRNEER